MTEQQLTEFLQTASYTMPLVKNAPWNATLIQEIETKTPRSLFPGSFSPEGAMAGLWLYAGCWEKAHEIAQDLHTPEGSYWHGIVHRQEPDAWNSNYWFRQTGRHAIFPALNGEAQRLSATRPRAAFPKLDEWRPEAFVEFCEIAGARPGSEAETLAREIQQIEWKMLYEYCSRR